MNSKKVDPSKKVGRRVCILPVTPTNHRNSEGCFVRLKDNSILYAWSEYYNCGDDLGQADIGCIRSYDEGETWVERRVLYGNGRENIMCPHLLRMDNGDLGLIYVFHPECKNGTSIDDKIYHKGMVYLVRSEDEGLTWSEPLLISDEEKSFCFENGHGIRLKSGRILLPMAYHRYEKGCYGGLCGYGVCYFYMSDDDGRTWYEGPQRVHGVKEPYSWSGLQEPAPYQMENGRIRVFSRTDLGLQYETYSDDDGLTWSEAFPCKDFPSPCSPLVMKRAGELTLAVYNPVPPHHEPHGLTWRNERDPMVLSVSSDDGKTFDKIFCLDDDAGCTYPDIFDGGDYALIGYQNFNDGDIIKVDLDELRDLTLVKDGTTDYVIVGAENASPTEKTAAAELADYIKRITGVDVPVVTDKEPVRDREIVVGKTNREAEGQFDRAELGEEGYLIKTVGEKVFIVGSEVRGVLYGVYGFLDDHLGCRFFTNDFELIPYRGTIRIPKRIEDKQIPVFAMRDLYWQSLNQPDVRVKLKLNGQEGHNIPEEKGGHVGYVDHLFCHTLLRLSEMACPDNETPTPCLNDEERYQTVLKNVRASIKKDPKGRVLSITQMDNYNRCQCATCKAAEEAEGSGQGSLLPFINRIADDIKDESPNVLIDTFAYYYSLDVPKTLKANDNVVIRLCSILSCFSHPLTECCKEFYEPENTRFFAENLRAWSKRCKNIHIWDYTTNFNHYLTPFPNLRVLRQNMRFFAENNVTGVFEQGAGNSTVGGELGELRAYLLAKLLWNPYMSEEEYERHMMDFLMSYYCTGGYYIRQYIDLLEEWTKDVHFNIYSDPLDIIPPRYKKNDKPLPPPTEISADVDWLAYADNEEIIDWSFIDESYRIFGTAYPMAGSPGSICWEHVRSTRMSVLYYEIILTFHKYGKRLEDQIRKVVSEADFERAMAFAEEQRCKVFRELNQSLRDEMIHFGIARLAEGCEYNPTWPCNLNNEPVEYWREENFKKR